MQLLLALLMLMRLLVTAQVLLLRVFRGNLAENLMGQDNNPKTITINDVEYDATTFTDEQVILTNHCLDLDRKISNMNFQLQQLQVGKDSFLKMLTESLETVEVVSD
jgi:hypothetical protein